MTLSRLVVRQVRRSTVIWALVVAVALSAGISTYATAYRTEASRQLLITQLGANPAFEALYGQARAIDTTGGFVQWRYGAVIVTVVGLWALLTTSRVLRGDEEAGRADLLGASPIRPAPLLVTQLVTIAAAALAVGMVTSVVCLAGGLPVGGSTLFGLVVAAGGWVFGGLAAVASQVFPTRRQAAGWTGALLGASYLVRAVADGSDRGWLAWISPLGWVERASPFVHPSLVAVTLLVAVSLALGAVAVVLRGRRDTGEGLVRVSDRPRGAGRPLRSDLALDWRLGRATLAAWAAGVLVVGVVFGFLAVGVAQYAQQDAGINDVTSRVAGASVATTQGFLGLAFAILALILAAFAVAQLVAAREEESSGRIEPLLVAGVSRRRWLGTRTAMAVAAVVALALVGAVGTWVGTALSGDTSALGPLLRGALNTVPLALVFGGVAVLAFGWWPRSTAAVAFGVLTVAYLVQLVGALARAPQWVLDLSPFTHLAPVPAGPVDVTSTLVMVAVALGAAALGGWAFLRRDVVPG